MDSTAKMLFALQRFQILALYTNSAAERTVSSSYAFAWFQSVYPVASESAPWHVPHAASFAIGRGAMKELNDFLAECWSNKSVVTFYELEDRYGIKGPRRPGPVWGQDGLIQACRYLYLYQKFDSAFWSKLLSGSQCPMEAEAISRKFEADDVYFE